MKGTILMLLCLITVAVNSYSQYSSSNWEKFRSFGPGLEQAGWIETKTSEEIESSPWSIGCETLDRSYTVYNNYKGYIEELGIKSARLQGGWARCEKEKGRYDFNWLDSIVYDLSQRGIKPWICLCYSNPLYSSDVQGVRIFESEETLDAWCNWVKAIVRHYKDVVTEWEIWNEPNRWEGDPAVYANLLIRTSEIIKGIQPDGEIIAFALRGIQLDFVREVLDILKRENKIGIVDYISYHHYEFIPKNSYPEVEKLRALAHSYNPEIKLFQGENAAPSDNHYFYHALCDYPWTEVSQAKWYTRRMAGDRIRGIRSSIFTVVDIRYPDVLLSMGLFRANLLQEVLCKKPAFYAVQHMANILDGSVLPAGEVSFKLNSLNTREISVGLLKKGDSPILLIWLDDRVPSDDFAWNLADISIPDIHFKDPVYVEAISGKVYELEKTDWKNRDGEFIIKNLPVWDGVILIAERSEINLTNYVQKKNSN